MPDLTDEELVDRCKAGSEDAFAELVGRYRNLVFGLITRTVGDRERSEDLAQEVFLRIYKGLPYYRGTARLSTWIYRICINVALSERTAPRRLEMALDDEAASELGREVTDDKARHVELRDRLEKAMTRLPSSQRFLVAAHYLKGVRYEDLADALNLPLGTVKTNLFRAKRELRRMLETEFK
jgi:RNA polymerase sigma-70 factor (ECF subfamily)